MNSTKNVMQAVVVVAALLIVSSSTTFAGKFCKADCNGDCTVNLSDLVTMKSEFMSPDCEACSPPYPAPVPKTGQTISFATGDDGDLRKGVAWPNPRFTIIYYDATRQLCANQTADCDGNPLTDLVKDNLTGLIWTRDAGMSHLIWNDAFIGIGFMNAGRQWGYDDWRVPNIRELESLIDFLGGAGFAPFLPSGHPFQNVNWSSGNEYWSSTQWITLGPPAALTTSFLDGLRYQRTITDTHYVWPVRGGQ